MSQHYHRIENLENGPPPPQSNLSPFKNLKGAAIPSPPDTKATPVLHHHHVPRHHHHQVTPTKQEPVRPVSSPQLAGLLSNVQSQVAIPLPKKSVRSQAILDSVAHLPREHLGHGYYQPKLKAGSGSFGPRAQFGFASNPEPLPNFEGSENCTYTLKIPRTYLAPESRREITYRKAVRILTSHVAFTY